MFKHEPTRKRLLFWSLMVGSLILIAFGYWQFNRINFSVFSGIGPAAQDNYETVLDSVNQVGQEVEGEMENVNEIIAESIEEVVEEKKQEQATNEIIDNIIEEIDNNYAQEESDQETGEEETVRIEEGDAGE